MKKLIIAALISVALVGCDNQPRQYVQQPQYIQQPQTIVVDNDHHDTSALVTGAVVGAIVGNALATPPRQDTTIIQNKTVIVNPTQNQPAATPQVQAQKTFRPSISPTSTQPKVQAPTQTFRPSVAAAPKVSAPAPASRPSVSSSKPATSSFRPSVKR